jgi:trigger factor
VRVEKPGTEVSEAEVDEYLTRLRERFAELQVVAHPARRGDFVIADVRVEVHGQEVPEASRQELLYEVGSNEFVPKLDEELEGKRKGEILQFNAVLPEQFGERAGEEVSFRVLVKEVKEKKLPDADDEFAKTASEFDSLEELRKDIETRVREVKQREADAEIRRRVLDELIDGVEVELPDRLIDEETNHRVQQAQQRAERIGMTLDQVLEAQGWDELRLRSDARSHSIRALKGDSILEAVARQEGLTVTPEELSASVAQLAQALGREPKDIAKTLERSGQVASLAGDIIRTKALDLLVERAEVIDLETPVKPKATSAEGTSETSSNE